MSGNCLGGIGIDIGGTKIGLAAVGLDGRIVRRSSMATEAEAGFERAVCRIERAVEEVLAGAGWKRDQIGGIGIGCAGPVDPARGTVHNPYTLPTWDGCNLVTALGERLGVSVRLENDADAALLGEQTVGAGRGFDNLVMLTLGTGVGGAVLVNGEIYRGWGGAHPELGHLAVRQGGTDCYCGGTGCLESIASGTAIAGAGRAIGLTGSREVFERAEQSDARAGAIVERAVEAVASAVWTLLHTFVPQRVILGGGIIEERYSVFERGILERLSSATMVPKGEISVARAALGNDAGVVGAARLVIEI